MSILDDTQKVKKVKKVIVKRAPRTMKEKKFVKEYIENGGNATVAALKAYDTTSVNSAKRIGSENTTKLNFDYYFEKAGLTDEVIAQSITRKVLSATKQNQFTGEIEDDHAIQLKATELALKVMGKFAPEKAPVNPDGSTVIPILYNVFCNNGNPQTIVSQEKN